MKKTSLIIGAICLLSNFVFADERITVAITIVPQKYFVERIAGERVEIIVMVPPGSDYHAYEPTARQMRALTRSRLYFSIGGEFEQVWLPRFQRTAPRLRIVATDEGIEKISMDGGACCPAGHHHHHVHEHGESDPHIWLSPRLVKHQARIIRDALIDADPEHEQYYRKRCELFIEELKALDEELRALFDELPEHRPFMVYHPTYGYLAHDYGLEQIPIEVRGREPTLRELRDVMARAKEEGLSKIFTQPQYSRRTAEQVAQAIGGEVVVTDPLAENWRENLLDIAREIHESLHERQ